MMSNLNEILGRKLTLDSICLYNWKQNFKDENRRIEEMRVLEEGETVIFGNIGLWYLERY